MKKTTISILLVIFGMISTVIFFVNFYEVSIGVKNVVGRTYTDSNFPKIETVDEPFIHVRQLRVSSQISGLYILCRQVQAGTEVIVCWNEIKKSFIINEELEPYDFIWRNQKSGFCYFLHTNNNTRTELHYVEIKKDFDNIRLNNKIIASRNDGDADPNIRWSDDGQYFTWPDHAMVNIYKFGTRKRWYTKSLIIYEGEKKKVINCPNPPMSIFVVWEKGGRNLVFSLDDTDYPDEAKTLYRGLIDLSQFGLN